jgi:proline dehydrogenase
MLRSFLIYISKAAWARRIITGWSFARRAAKRFEAGEKLDDAITVVRALNAKGIYASIDHLGEHTTDAQQARQATKDMLTAIDGIIRAGVLSNVSLKLTQVGLALDEDLCRENLVEILTHAKEHKLFVRIDMEDSPWVETTIKLYREMRQKGFDNVGLVIQSYLYRSEGDVRELATDCTRIRLCKGAYKEPPEIAYPKKRDVDASFDNLAEMLLDCAKESNAPIATQDGKMPAIPAIATHDERRIDHAKAYASKIKLPRNALEFQMLYGIRRDLQEQLVAQGYPVRVYVPYGTEWYPYYIRRLAERPANVWFFISNFFRG